MNDPISFRLKPEDSAPADPQAIGIALMETLADHTTELAALRDLLTRWGTDPTGVCRRAQPRTVELAEQAGRLRDLAESLMQASRSARTFSAAYRDEPIGGW